MRAWAAALALLTLAGCSDKTPSRAPYMALDCSKPFDEQAARLIAQPQIVPAPEAPAEPYRFFSSADGRTSYLITKPGAPGHPAIMMQQAKGGDIVTTGCPYGDRKAYEAIHAYLDGLKHWTRQGGAK